MTRKDALQYVKNTNGCATPDNFIEDWMPVGGMEWDMLTQLNLVRVDDNGKIWLTEAGQAKLNELNGAMA